MNSDNNMVLVRQGNALPSPSYQVFAGKMRGRPLSERLWARIDKNGPVPTHRPELGPCWLWTGGTNNKGYAGIYVHGHSRSVHGLVYETIIGPVPTGLVLDHKCRVRHCCNPAHLEPVTDQVNILRGVGEAAKHAAQTHCAQGHPFDETNTIYWRAFRLCRKCRAAQYQQRKARQAARGMQ